MRKGFKMADKVEILDIESIWNIWNKPCEIKNGDILDTVYCHSSRKILFVKNGEEYKEFEEKDNLIRDEDDCLVWADQSDVESEYLIFL